MLSDKVGDGAHDTYEECCSFLNFPRVSNKSYNIFFTYGILMLPLICYWRLWFESAYLVCSAITKESTAAAGSRVIQGGCQLCGDTLPICTYTFILYLMTDI